MEDFTTETGLEVGLQDEAIQKVPVRMTVVKILLASYCKLTPLIGPLILDLISNGKIRPGA